MKHILTTIALFLCMVSYSQKSTLTVNVMNFKNNQGKAMVAIYSAPGDFLKKPLYGKVSDIKDKTAKVVFENLPNGKYAISTYHDENNNQKLDTGWFGIPKEGYGCSNDAKGNMGPPKFEDAKFEVSSNKTINIKLN